MLHCAFLALNYLVTFLHFVSHHDTWCYTYNTFFYLKQNIHFTYTDLIRLLEDNIVVTEK